MPLWYRARRIDNASWVNFCTSFLRKFLRVYFFFRSWWVKHAYHSGTFVLYAYSSHVNGEDIIVCYQLSIRIWTVPWRRVDDRNDFRNAGVENLKNPCLRENHLKRSLYFSHVEVRSIYSPPVAWGPENPQSKGFRHFTTSEPIGKRDIRLKWRIINLIVLILPTNHIANKARLCHARWG